MKTIVLKPGPARRVDQGPGRPGVGTGPDWRKNRVRKNPMWPGWLGKTRLQPVDFCFFLPKRRRFDFKKKQIDPADSVTRSKPRTQAGHWTGSENYDENHDNNFISLFLLLDATTTIKKLNYHYYKILYF
jgi:hypothetical protein